MEIKKIILDLVQNKESCEKIHKLLSGMKSKIPFSTSEFKELFEYLICEYDLTGLEFISKKYKVYIFKFIFYFLLFYYFIILFLISYFIYYLLFVYLLFFICYFLFFIFF